MKSRKRSVRIAAIALQLPLAVVSALLVHAQTPKPAGEQASYRVSQTFHVGGEGAWDYLTVDSEHKLLYVPRSTHT